MVKVEAEVPSLLLLTNLITSTVPTLLRKKEAALKRLLRMKAVMPTSGYKTVNSVGKELHILIIRIM